MFISRLTLPALALMSLSLGANAHNAHRRLSIHIHTTSSFGSCAKGPCIRQADTGMKAHD
jgi:hypothetical protein